MRQLEHGGAQDVPGLDPAHAHAIVEGYGLVVVDGRELGHGGCGVVAGVERDVAVRCSHLRPSLVALALEGRVFLLDLGRIQHDQAGQINRSTGGEDGALQALLDDARDQAGVVKVRVGEQEEVDRARVERRRLPVAADELALLEHAASR